MAIATSTYYGLIKVRDMSPNASDWAATDTNWEFISLIMKANEQHKHTGNTGTRFPGYNSDPTKIILPTLTPVSSGGVLTPGTTVGVRLAYVDGSGLETSGAPEQDQVISTTITPPTAPTLTSLAAGSGAVGGGLYIYGITKTNGSGETTISQVLQVTVPFDQTYNVTIAFDAINTYTDGTTGINIYRANGQNSSFQLLTKITSTSAASFTDTNTIAPGNQNVQPPSTSTFNATYKMHIDFSALTYPATASFLNVYVTRQAGIWGSQCLLSQLALTGGSPPTSIDYLGNESLGAGSPKNGSQIVNAPPKVVLASESDLGTVDADLNGFQLKGLRLQNASGVPTEFTSPKNGDIYYDSSVPTVRAYINGGWVNWGTTTATAYTHPSAESGGHDASHILYDTHTGTTVDAFMKKFLDSTGSPKQVQVVAKASPGTTITTASTSLVVSDLTTTFTPNFNNQWAQISGFIVLQGDTTGMNISVGWQTVLGLSTINGPALVWQVDATSEFETITFADVVQFATGTSTVNLYWYVSTGTATAVGSQRGLSVIGLL